MPEKIYIGNFSKGLATNRKPFNIDNDAFPLLWNFYSWRGRIKKKRGTTLLGQLEIQSQSVINSSPPASYQIGTLFTLNGDTPATGSGNLISTSITNITQATNAVVTLSDSIFIVGDVITISGVVGMTQVNGHQYTIISRNVSSNQVTLNVNSTAFTAYTSGGTMSLYNFTGIEVGSVVLSDGTNTYTDNSMGVLTGVPAGSGTINYATGVVTITGGVASQPIIGTFSYYSGLPVMGLEDYMKTVPVTDTTGLFRYPLLLAFDTMNAYQFNQSANPNFFYNVSYYKASQVPVSWSGTDYQLFWSTNYENAFWAVNDKPGLHYLNIATISVGNPTTITTTNPNPLVTGDYVWFNQITGANAASLNGLAFQVTVSNSTTFTVAINTTAQTINNSGIFQLLTNSIPGQDGIRWYDGDPTNATGLPTNTGTGWVNFAPPLTATSTGIDTLPSGLYYLVGAQIVVPFKDRILFFGPWVQIAGQAPINLQDTVIWSWNGTPYYTVQPSNTYFAPQNQTADPTAYYIDQAGKGGYIAAGISQPIVTVNNNEDVLLVGFTGRQTRFIYTGNDLSPFAFFTINSELGSSSTFSGITLDRGGLTFGTYGLAMTTQQSSQRIDLEIPDEVFNIQGMNSGAFRVNSVRDFYREWVYFSFPVDGSPWKFPTQSLLYNYRDNTWAILYENYTVHGSFYAQSGKTWNQLTYFTWSNWNDPWDSGIDSALFPRVIAGNPQGYVLTLDEDTEESPSGTIQAISSNMGLMQITSNNHCTNANPVFPTGDYLYISGVLGLKTSTITAITVGASTVISTVNTFTVGYYVTVSGIVGTVGAILNGNSYKIEAASGVSITINVNTTGLVYSSGGTLVSTCNGQIVQVDSTQGTSLFTTDLPVPEFTTSYLGGGQYSRLCQPLLQTKQFPMYWEQGRQVRLGMQQYLLDYTQSAQVTLNIYLSQDSATVWNMGPVLPQETDNSSLEYSQILYTCPESTNLGLTPANVNLQTPTAMSQASIWHRINTSLQGETIQIGITLSDAQMRNLNYATAEITLQGIILTVSPGPLLS